MLRMQEVVLLPNLRSIPSSTRLRNTTKRIESIDENSAIRQASNYACLSGSARDALIFYRRKPNSYAFGPQVFGRTNVNHLQRPQASRTSLYTLLCQPLQNGVWGLGFGVWGLGFGEIGRAHV